MKISEMFRISKYLTSISERFDQLAHFSYVFGFLPLFIPRKVEI